ncbi:MAG: putative thiol oxidoreductase [Rickettsiales bacterium]|jgi:CxxC motif-containing protein (DUF1111 family)|nr:putative thiol oxidoreductase [Rickettsiales bacterium]
MFFSRSRYFLLSACLALSTHEALAASSIPETVLASPLSGGETTVHNTSRDAFAKPAANLETTQLRDFTFGNKMFNTNWVVAPASVSTLDGLGPTFNRVSCSGCHFKDGRGHPPLQTGDVMQSMLMRLSVPGLGADGGPKPHPVYGDQLNDKAILGVPAEGKATILYKEVPGTYPDGTKYSLRKPEYVFSAMGLGELGKDTLFSPRVAPAVFGLGLLEAIPDETLMGWEDPDDKDKDEISGRINHVWDAISKKKAIGRFGWKANVASIKHQDAGAAQGDIGITTSVFPKENCPKAQEACNKAINGGTPEMSDEQLKKLTFYIQTLAVPARRNVNDPMVQKGAKLFEEARCTSCHKPQAFTGKHPVKQVSEQHIQPFTDLLLHDMGKELADNRPDYEATGSEWRTAPLWGLGLIKTVNKHTMLLHDGRARNVEEAILWHGGEAEAAKQAFRTMDKKDREALIAFLDSL